MEPLDVLRKYWNYPSFRPLQEDIISASLDGKNVLALLPTGGGKSICFQIPALINEGLALVISPLIALMRDQVQQLRTRGIVASAIYSGQSEREIDHIMDNCVYGEVKILYVSPERLKTKLFQERAQRMNLSMLVIDEAHCISEWGYDFRPAYLSIVEFRELHPEIPVMALTATATPEVQKDITDRLSLEIFERFEGSYFRSNLSYSVFELENKFDKVLEVLDRVPGSSIIYAGTRKKVQDLAAWLNGRGYRAAYYHAGLASRERARREEQWKSGSIRVMVATNAFGMGIDKGDVRSVIHTALPQTLEAYYQEAGRAGRDGKMAYSVLLFDQNDIAYLQKEAETSMASAKEIRVVYQALANYFKLAVGSHANSRLPIVFNEFLKTYSLDTRPTMYAIRALADLGILELSERFNEPAKLRMVVDRQEMYAFQVANARFDPIIKTVLRLYGGELFSGLVRIDEKTIAEVLELEEKTIRNELRYLNDSGVLEYRPSIDSTSILFLMPRMRSEDLPIDEVFIERRRKLAIDKARTIIGYALEQNRCRTNVFQAYFGESDTKECGVCDFCLRTRKAPLKAEEVIKALNQNPSTIDELSVRLNQNKDLIIQMLRRLIDDGLIRAKEDKFYLN